MMSFPAFFPSAHKRKKTHAWMKTGAVASALVLVSACAVVPEPFGLTEKAQLAQTDLGRIFENQEPVSGKITLYEAIARALKYNLDHKVALMEEAVAVGASDISKFSLLPQINADVDVSRRSNISASSSTSIRTGTQSLEPSRSSDQTSKTAGVKASWNILDFGVSYFNSKQMADQALVAGERRRKAIQNIIQDVRSAYWRAVAAEQYVGWIDTILVSIDKAMGEAKTIEQRGLRPPIQVLTYQRRLLETKLDLQHARRRLIIARTELAALMNIRPGTRFELSVPETNERSLPELAGRLKELEEHAFLNRPEINEERYQKRVAVADVKKEILRMLPGLEFNASYNWDANSFLVNNDFYQAGFLISKNLIDVVAGPDRIAAAETRQQLADERRMAINMAVLTQVNVAYQGYALSQNDFALVSEISHVRRSLFKQIDAQQSNGSGDDLALIDAEADAVLGAVDKALAYADLQEAFARVLNASGVHPLPDSVPADDLTSVTKAVRDHLGAIEQGHLNLSALQSSTEQKQETAIVQAQDEDASFWTALWPF